MSEELKKAAIKAVETLTKLAEEGPTQQIQQDAAVALGRWHRVFEILLEEEK